jgi:hypothetical protein
MNIAKAKYNEVVDAVASGQRIEVRALSDWNGFVNGGVYELHSASVSEGLLSATDENGIFTRIHPDDAVNFELVTELAAALPQIPMHVRLQSLASSLLEPQEPFKVGDVVVVKNGLNNKRMPDYGEPAVVTSLLPQHTFDDGQDTGTPYYMEPLTMKIGVLLDGEQFIEIAVDGRRFRHFDPETDPEYQKPEPKQSGFGGGFPPAVMTLLRGSN